MQEELIEQLGVIMEDLIGIKQQVEKRMSSLTKLWSDLDNIIGQLDNIVQTGE